MVNMNKHKEPAIYGLKDSDGGFFYVGKTSGNALNRWWQHRSRAMKGHNAPVYRRMRELGVDSVTFEVLHFLGESDDSAQIEADWIKRLVDRGEPIVNAMGRNGIPNSISPETRATMGVSRRGKSTWIKGKTGIEAGWTDERRAAQKEKMRGREYPVQHGTVAQRQRGCDCERCIATGAVVKTPPPPRVMDTHGTVASYKHGKCRCDDCRTAYREYQRRFYGLK